jgi:hypothetical protein
MGVLYRMGGSGNYPRQARLIGVPLLAVILLAVCGGWNWWLLLCIPLMIGAISTYWKKKGSDAKWWNWLLHGLGIAVAMLPYAIATQHYVGFGIRCLVLPLLIMLWSERIGNAVWEEWGRGFLIGITIPLLLI